MKKFVCSIASILTICLLLPLSSVSAYSDDISMQKEEIIKNEIVELYPEKFENTDTSDMSLYDIQKRAGTHSEMVMNGSKKTQSNVFLGVYPGAGWARSANGIIDFTTTKSCTVSFKTSYTWDAGAAVEASISTTSGTAITHHEKAYKDKICTIALFGDVKAKEYTLYVYDNYTNQLLHTSKGTVTGVYLDGVYDGQTVKKFYNRNYTVRR